MSSKLDLDVNKYSKSEMEEILSLNYPYNNSDIQRQSDYMVQNLCRDANLQEAEKSNISLFIGAIKTTLMLPSSPKKKHISEQINPQKREKVLKTVNIDTRFRDNYYNTKSSDFTFNLTTPIKNVVSMVMQEFELPQLIYSIHRDLKNNYFYIGTTKITLSDGSYTREEMQSELNEQLPTDYSAVIDNRSHKTIFAYSDNFALYFNKDANGNKDKGTSLQLGLGWLLGFRFAEYTNASSYVSEGLYKEQTPEYLYLAIDDNNHNINNNFIGAFNSSILNNNILAKFTRKCPRDCEFLPIGSVQRLKRDYFGPVNIRKLKIQLLDAYGRIVPMNHMDFSFLIKFECIYEV